MSVVIFFGYSLLIVLVGFVFTGVTFYRWWKESQLKDQRKVEAHGTVEPNS